MQGFRVGNVTLCRCMFPQKKNPAQIRFCSIGCKKPVPIIDLLKDFTSSLVPRGHIGIGWANNLLIRSFCSPQCRHTAKPLCDGTLNKEVYISMRFIINLPALNFTRQSVLSHSKTCDTRRGLSSPQLLRGPDREVFQLPHNGAGLARADPAPLRLHLPRLLLLGGIKIPH